jgi:RNA polymerase sigma-70 factor (ECF subfamily)
MDAPSLIEDLRAVVGGDRAAWERLVQALAGRLHAAAYRILGDVHAAEDATQEAFLALGRAAADFRGEDDAAVERWAVAIACRTALMHARGRGRREQRVRTGLPAEVETMAAESEREGADPLTLAKAMRALHRLPEQHRLPITLHVFGSLDGPELARELGLTANAARVRLHRAFKKLEALLAAEGVTAAPALICGDLAKASPPPPGHDLLARCRGLDWASPSPPTVSPRRIIMASTAAAGLALIANLAFTLHTSASDAPAPAPKPADPPHVAAPAPEPAAPKLSLQWEVEAPGNSFAATPPLVAGDALLLSGSDEIRCVDRATGAMRWSLPGEFAHSRPGRHGDEVVVLMDGLVEALALADGSSRWSVEVSRGSDASVVVHGERALIASRDGSLRALDLAHRGAVLWKAENQGETAWAPGVGAKGDLLLPLWNSAVVCVDENTGSVRWRTKVPGLGAEAPICRDGVVYALAGDPETDAGGLVALDEGSGKQLWRKQVPQDRLPPPPSTSSSAGVDGAVVVKSGTLPMKTVSACAGPVRVGDVLAVGSATDLLGYAPDGTLRWRVPFAAFGYRTFTVDDQGRLWAGGDHGELLVVSSSGRELLRADLNHDSEITRLPATEAVGGGRSFASVGSLSNPGLDADQIFILATGGVALCWTTKAQF